MSIIFGIANFDSAPVEAVILSSVAELTRRYALDGTFIDAAGSVGMGFQPYHTTERSRLETQPLSDAIGNRVVFDGRLDNHAELAHLLSMKDESSTDSSVVLAAFDKWGKACFERFVGDWSLALWCGRQRELYLARDHAGTRTLYYRFQKNRVVWSTYLETFLSSGEAQTLDEEFAARFLSGMSVGSATPYAGIRFVPAAHVLIFSERTISSFAHWSCVVGERLDYQDSEQYDDQFVECFERSVQRRDIAGAPILAELSGGMDSTAIVCVSDALRRRGDPESLLLDTLSLYDDSEADWDELPYVVATEKYRRKSGLHFATSYLNKSFALAGHGKPSPYPGYDCTALQREEQFEARVGLGGYRVILSGMGGDELLGGVPTPYPELADHIVSRRLGHFLGRTTEWCLSTRDVFIPTLWRAVRFAFEVYRHPLFDRERLSPWVSSSVKKLSLEMLRRDEQEYPRRGYLPSALGNTRNWLSILENLPHVHPGTLVRREYRYPYLDRDLVGYLLRVPREHLVGPGRRRAMMRRALKSLMPVEVVERRRKAFVARGLYAFIQREQDNIDLLLQSSWIGSLGLVDVPMLKQMLRTAASGTETPWTIALLRTLSLELWLRSNHELLGSPGKRSVAFGESPDMGGEANGIPMVTTAIRSELFGKLQ